MTHRLLPAGAIVAMLVSLPGAAPAAAATSQAIAVVVDFGTSGSFDGFVRCVHEPEGATDAQALVDALTQEGLAGPTFASSGLMCTIAGVPAAGCGTRTPAGYSYWAYFHGSTGQWAYANDGPAERRASPATVQGWRFEPMGRGNPTDPIPRSQPDVNGICGAASPAATTTPTTGAGSSIAIPVAGVTQPGGSPVGSGDPSVHPGEAGEPAGASTTSPTGPTTTSAVAEVRSSPRPLAFVAARATGHASEPANSSVGTIVVLGAILAGVVWAALLWRRRRV